MPAAPARAIDSSARLVRTLAVVPIKSFDAAKRRLSEALPAGSRHLLAQSMFADVVAALRRVRRLDALAVVTNDHEAEAVVRGEAVTLLSDERPAGQSAAARIGVRHALQSRFDRLLLVPGDTPLVDPGELDRLLDESGAEDLACAIVPDRHGTGTNALLLAPPDALEPSFGPGSLGRHLEAARTAGLDHRVAEVPSLLHDVDTPEDLEALVAALEQRRGVAPRTRGALRQFERLRAPAPGADGRGARLPVSA